MSVPPVRSGPRPCGSSLRTTGRSPASSSARGRSASSSRTGPTAASANGSAMRGSSLRPVTGCFPTTRARSSTASGSTPRPPPGPAPEALRRAGAQKVVLMGSSLGALAVDVAAAALPVQPDAVVSLSAPASVGFLRGLDSVAHLHEAVFFMAEQDDQPFADDAHSLYAAAASADKQLRVVPGSLHGSGMLEDPSLKATVWSFIAAHTR